MKFGRPKKGVSAEMLMLVIGIALLMVFFFLQISQTDYVGEIGKGLKNLIGIPW